MEGLVHTAAVVRRGVQIETLSVLWMVVEAIVAIWAGIAAHSLALTAFGADSVIELVTGAILLWRLEIEVRGGSMRQVETAEKRASWVVGMALIALTLYIVVMAGYDLWSRAGARTTVTGLALAVVSGVLMPYFAVAKKRIGTAMGSVALRADGACSIVCAYLAWTVIAGLLVNALVGWWWVNAVAGLALAYFIVKEGIKSIQEACGMDDACGCGLD